MCYNYKLFLRKKVIKYLQIKQIFDAPGMQEEVLCLNENLWKEHYNKMNFEGDWQVLPLRSINGDMNNIISIHSSSSSNVLDYKDTELLNRCPALQSVIHFFECEKTSVRLMNLKTGAIIKEHMDHEMSYEEGEVRFHIPVFTNTGVHFMLDDERVIMQEGECWYLNLSLKHSVSNQGKSDRVHLVIDCKVNDWIKSLFTENVTIQKDIVAEKNYIENAADRLKIITELRMMNTPTSVKLANKMENEINE